MLSLTHISFVSHVYLRHTHIFAMANVGGGACSINVGYYEVQHLCSNPTMALLASLKLMITCTIVVRRLS
jgi:hypothetical protein